MQCPICNKVASDSARFCDQCGHDLQSQQTISEADTSATNDAHIEIVEPIVGELPPEPVESGASISSDIEHGGQMPDQLDPLPEEPASVIEPDPAATGELPIAGPRLVLQGDGAIYTLSAGQDIIIGREDPLDDIYPDIDLTPHDTDTGVSRQHASLHEQGDQWFIKDLASTNYTIVNRRRLTAHEDFLLEDGDELRFGRVVTEFKIA